MTEEVVVKAIKRLCPVPRDELIDCEILEAGWKLKYRYDDSIRVVVCVTRGQLGRVTFVELRGIHKNKDHKYSKRTTLAPSAIRKEYMYYEPSTGEVKESAYQKNVRLSSEAAKQNASNHLITLNPITVEPAIKVEATQTGRFPAGGAADDGPQKKVNKQLTDTSQINRTQERLSYVLNILSEQVMPQVNWIVGELNKQAQFRLALKEAAVTFLKNVDVK